MGESALVMHSFSYSNEAKQGNPMQALGDSISFGRYMTESLSWEKWSTFSSKRYVEEAKSYAQPGSVAQKKAFFEAHYKKIAAMKEAALLEQQHEQKKTNQEPQITSPICDTEKTPTGFPDTPAKQAPPTPPRLENFITPLSRSSTTRSVDERRSPSPKPGMGLVYSTPEKEASPAARRSDSSRVSPLRTPVVVSEKGMLEDASATTPSEKRRSGVATDPPASVSKTAGPKWHLLSSVSKSIKSKLKSPALSKPFSFRTEERAARRKQKLEDKFTSTTKEAEKVQQQKTTLKEKAGTEFRKLRRSLCFSTQLPPDYDSETTRERDQVNNNPKTPLPKEQPAKKGRRKTSSEALLGGTTSVPGPVITSPKKVSRKRG